MTRSASSSRTMRPRDWPAAHEAFLRLNEPPGAGDARQSANPYKRPSLRAAFNSGWWSLASVKARRDDSPPPQFSTMGAAAWRAGLDARRNHEREQENHASTAA